MLAKSDCNVEFISLSLDIVICILKVSKQFATDESEKIFEIFEKSQCLEAIEAL